MDGRFITEYKRNIVNNQRTVLHELEKRGFEHDSKRIMTIDSFGVPVTSLVLLLFDALDSVKKFQNELDENYDPELKAIDKNELPSAISTKIIDKEINEWGKK